MPDEFNPPRRSRNLSDADIQALLEAFQAHNCKFSDAEIVEVRRVTKFFDTCEKQILSGIKWFFITLIGGIVYILYTHGWWIKK